MAYGSHHSHHMDSKYSGAAVSTDAQPDSDPAAWALGQAVRPPMPTLTCRAPLLSPMLSDLPRSANVGTTCCIVGKQVLFPLS